MKIRDLAIILIIVLVYSIIGLKNTVGRFVRFVTAPVLGMLKWIWN